MDNVQILETAKAKKAKGIDLNNKETELYNNYLNVMQAHPNTYKNDAYGLLSELYDNLQSFDLSNINDDDFNLLVFDIDNAINNIIDYVKKYDLETEKLNSIIGMVKVITKIKHKITIIPNEDYNELNDAFNFDLDNNNELIRTDNGFYYENLIRDTIKGIEAAEPKKEANEKPKPASKEVLSEQITHPKKTEIAKAIKDKYSSYKGKDFKILYEALLQLDLFPKKGKRSTYFRCLKNEHYNIKNKQILEDIYFKRGSISAKGNYQPSTDEIQRDGIIEYLKTIIDTN